MSLADHDVKILTLDIETFPMVTWTFSLRSDYTAVNQIAEHDRMACFAAKWYGQKKVMFWSEFHDGRDAMIEAAWQLLDEADILVTYNGPGFDVKWLQRCFAIEAGLLPPSTWRNVDLLKTARREFKFPSNKLEYVAEAFGVGRKVKHIGMPLWTGCMAGDEKSWATMKRYCMNDVRLTEDLYEAMGPWIKDHPHVGLWSGEDRSCFRCGGTDFVREGDARTPLTTYAEYRCSGCGAISRNQHRVNNVGMRAAR